eukprot:jgi/Mesvir1/5753/Mv11567-RA.1
MDALYRRYRQNIGQTKDEAKIRQLAINVEMRRMTPLTEANVPDVGIDEDTVPNALSVGEDVIPGSVAYIMLQMDATVERNNWMRAKYAEIQNEMRARENAMNRIKTAEQALRYRQGKGMGGRKKNAPPPRLEMPPMFGTLEGEHEALGAKLRELTRRLNENEHEMRMLVAKLENRQSTGETDVFRTASVRADAEFRDLGAETVERGYEKTGRLTDYLREVEVDLNGKKMYAFVPKWKSDASQLEYIKSSDAKKGGKVVLSDDGDYGHINNKTLGAILGRKNQLLLRAFDSLVHLAATVLPGPKVPMLIKKGQTLQQFTEQKARIRKRFDLATLKALNGAQYAIGRVIEITHDTPLLRDTLRSGKRNMIKGPQLRRLTAVEKSIALRAKEMLKLQHKKERESYMETEQGKMLKGMKFHKKQVLALPAPSAP